MYPRGSSVSIGRPYGLHINPHVTPARKIVISLVLDQVVMMIMMVVVMLLVVLVVLVVMVVVVV